MTIYATREFWNGAAERAIKTGAQFVLAVLGIGITAGGIGSEEAQIISAFAIDWLTVGGAFLGGAFASIAFSLAAPKHVPDVDIAIPDGEGKHRAEDA